MRTGRRGGGGRAQNTKWGKDWGGGDFKTMATLRGEDSIRGLLIGHIQSVLILGK
jgi:hypothetical protein